jgi:hypothetical protein
VIRGILLVPLALASVGGLVACGDGGGSDRSAETTTRATAGSTSTTDDTSSVTIGIICTSPAEAASTLVSAWTAGDRGAAERCATAAVVEDLFATSGAGSSWTAQGCETSSPDSSVCAYGYEGGAALLTVAGSDAAGWKVTKLRFVAD